MRAVLSRLGSSPAGHAALLSLAPLSAGALGLLVMAPVVAPVRLAIQAGALLAGALLATGLAAIGRARLRAAAPWAALLALILLAAPLADAGLEGVRRWIDLGPVRVHASSLASPALLAGAAALLPRGRGLWSLALLLAAQALHALHPDAGQATALAAGGVALLAAGPLPRTLRIAGAIALAASIAPPWAQRDPLPALPAVEGIVRLAAERAAGVGALAVALLALVPAGLALAARSARSADAFPRAASVALVAYVSGTLAAPVLGNFPVPVMGFGVSPILGIALCTALVAALSARGGSPPAGSPAGA